MTGMIGNTKLDPTLQYVLTGTKQVLKIVWTEKMAQKGRQGHSISSKADLICLLWNPSTDVYSICALFSMFFHFLDVYIQYKQGQSTYIHMALLQVLFEEARAVRAAGVQRHFPVDQCP